MIVPIYLYMYDGCFNILAVLQAEKPQETLLVAHKVCRRLGIDHATIQVHDAGDTRFCYSETCDDAEVGAAGAGAGAGSSGKRKACV